MIRVWESKPKHDGIDGKRVPGVHDGHPTPDPSQRTGWRLTATSDTPTPRHTDSHLGIVGLGFQAVSATPYLENWGCSRLRLTENPGKLQNFRKFFGLPSNSKSHHRSLPVVSSRRVKIEIGRNRRETCPRCPRWSPDTRSESTDRLDGRPEARHPGHTDTQTATLDS